MSPHIGPPAICLDRASDFVNYRIIVGIVAQPPEIRGLLRQSAQSTD
jgi:hypothetical protein